MLQISQSVTKSMTHTISVNQKITFLIIKEYNKHYITDVVEWALDI